MSDLKSKAEHAIDETKSKVKAAADSVADAARAAVPPLADGCAQLKDHAQAAYDDAYAAATVWEENLEQTIRRHPLQSVLIAAGVGAVLGWLWRSR